MSDTYLPVLFENDEFLVSWGGGQKTLTNQITVYEYSNGGYTNLGSLGQNNQNIKTNFGPNKYYVKTEDLNHNLGGGGNKSKRRQYRYRFSSKKRVASHRRSRGRGRQTRYSRRK